MTEDLKSYAENFRQAELTKREVLEMRQMVARNEQSDVAAALAEQSLRITRQTSLHAFGFSCGGSTSIAQQWAKQDLEREMRRRYPHAYMLQDWCDEMLAICDEGVKFDPRRAR